jgi:predicted nucleic acid-binding protein
VIQALDSNVFISYLAKNDIFFEPAKSIIDRVVAGEVQAICSTLVFGEVVYLTQQLDKLRLVDEFFSRLTACSEVPANKQICRTAARFRLNHRGLKLPDAIHLATAVEAKADKFVTADRQLSKIAAEYIDAKLLQ